MLAFSVRQFETLQGKSVFLEWMRRQRDPVAMRAILRRINRLEAGNFGDCAYCRDGVWELRIDVGAGYRLYYATSAQRIIVLLCGGDKRTQRSDIDRAVGYWNDWNRRKSNAG
ncbi:MAG: type II toxin-antitoxin system RelE/ParE family toxin [Gemmatimonadetes bacterium]|nr:type II toxin-antitoxin system RelE/ParE family toxin [Gemmatimonadota bacterium]